MLPDMNLSSCTDISNGNQTVFSCYQLKHGSKVHYGHIGQRLVIFEGIYFDWMSDKAIRSGKPEKATKNVFRSYILPVF